MWEGRTKMLHPVSWLRGPTSLHREFLSEIRCSAMWRCMAGLAYKDVSKEPGAFSFLWSNVSSRNPFKMMATRSFEIPRSADPQTLNHTPQDMQPLTDSIYFPFSLSNRLPPPPAFLSLYAYTSFYDTLFPLSSVLWIFIYHSLLRLTRPFRLVTYSIQQRPYWEDNWFCSSSRNSPHFMEPASSLPYSQAPTTCPYPEPTPSSPRNPFSLPRDPS